jgi:hypothetical protein
MFPGWVLVLPPRPYRMSFSVGSKTLSPSSSFVVRFFAIGLEVAADGEDCRSFGTVLRGVDADDDDETRLAISVSCTCDGGYPMHWVIIAGLSGVGVYDSMAMLLMFSNI